MFVCDIGAKQGLGCPASPLLFSLYLDELEALLEDASEHIDCPSLAQLLIAMLMFADDIALFSYSSRGLQHQLKVLQKFCTAPGLKVNVQKTKTRSLKAAKLIPLHFHMPAQPLTRLNCSNIWAPPFMPPGASQQP